LIAGRLSLSGTPYEKKVLGITAMTSMLGKKKFEELLGAYIYKPQGKRLTLYFGMPPLIDFASQTLA